MEAPISDPVGAARGARAYRAIYLALILAAIVFALVQSVVSPLLPLVQEHLHTDAASVTWVLTAYLISAAVATPVLARLGDVLGKRRVLVAVLGTFAVGCLVAALADSLAVLLVGRVLQGAAGALFPLSFAIIRDEAPPHRVATSIGVVSSLLAVGSGTSLVIAGPMTRYLGYSSVFWLPVVLSCAAFVAVVVAVPESRVRTPGLPGLLPTVLLAGWLVGLLLVVSSGSRWGWSSALTLGIGAAAVVLAAGWWLAERRAERPVVDVRLLRLRTVWTSNLVALAVGATVYGNFALIPRFLQASGPTGHGLGLSLGQAGLLLLPQTVGFALGGTLSGRLGRWLSPRRVLLTASLVATAGYGGLALFHASAWQIALVTLVSGTGNGLAFAVLPTIVMAAVPPTQTGAATGLNANVRLIGGAIGGQLVAAVAVGFGAAAAVPTQSGYTWAFAVLAGFAVTGALVGTLIPPGTRSAPAGRSARGDGGTAAGSLSTGLPSERESGRATP